MLIMVTAMLMMAMMKIMITVERMVMASEISVWSVSPLK